MENLSKRKLKELKKLKLKKYRDQEKAFLIEGEHLIEEARKSKILLNVYSLEDLSEKEIKEISSLECPSYLLGVCKKYDNNELLGKKYLLLDEIQDPGNLGTIIRSALGFNIDTIVLGNNCCDLYNEKVIRSSQGAFFHINIVSMDLVSCINKLKEKNIPVYGTNVKNGVLVSNIDSKDKYAVVMGNEGRGLNKDIVGLCDKSIYIETNKKLESLNVAMATSIILYELDKKKNN